MNKISKHQKSRAKIREKRGAELRGLYVDIPDADFLNQRENRSIKIKLNDFLKKKIKQLIEKHNNKY